MSISTYVADFEATVPPKSVDNIDDAKHQNLKVYCYGLRNINSDNTMIGYSVHEFMNQLFSLKTNNDLGANVIFHNLQYDGSYIIAYLLNNGYEQYNVNDTVINSEKFIVGNAKSFTVYHKGRIYNFMDSFKLYPFSLSKIGEALAKTYNLDLLKGNTPLITNDELDEYLNNNKDELLKYVKQDVNILWHLVNDRKLDLLLENKVSTIANYAYRTVIKERDIVELLKKIPYQYPHHYVVQLLGGKYQKRGIDYYKAMSFPIMKDGKRVGSEYRMNEGKLIGVKLEKGSTDYNIAKRLWEEDNKRRKENNSVIHENNINISYKPPKKQFRLPKNRKWNNPKLTNKKKIEQLSEWIKEEKEDKQYLIEYREQLRDTHFRTLSNSISKQGYGGGLTIVNPNYVGKVLDYVRVYDITSMYPFIYSNFKLPGKVKDFHEDITLDEIKQLDNLYTVKVNKMNVTVKQGKLPIVKHKHNNSELDKYIMLGNDDYLNYYNGKFISEYGATFTQPEFQYILENYNIHSMDIAYVVEHERDTVLERKFKQHCERYIQEKTLGRKLGDKVRELHAKLMLNSPYGKLGNYEKEYANTILTVDENGNLMEETVGHTIGGLGTYADVASASFITAYGRTYLAKYINKVGLNRFAYCDTDSIHVIGHESVPLPISDEVLGDFTLDDIKHDSIYLRPKTYGGYVDGVWKTTCAGISGTVPIEKFKVGEKVRSKTSCIGNTGRVIYDAWTEVCKKDFKFDNWIENNKQWYSEPYGQ